MQWIPRLMGIVPLGIGLTVIGCLWLTPFNQFGSPSLFFRVFGSFIALAFVLVGVGFIAGPSLVRGQGEHLKGMMQDLAKTARDAHRSGTAESSHATPEKAPSVGYDCPNCGASLGKDCDVSPSGDAKCGFCKRWFNIHNA
jgi:hypothetical protein